MTTIDIFQLSDKVQQKYTILNNTFVGVAKTNPKDRIEVEIGDSKQPFAFFPQVKVMRWDNEVNFSARLKDEQIAIETISTLDNKIVWDKGKRTAHLYEVPVSKEHPEGGYEFEIILKEKPLSNIIEFTIQTKGLDFFYQPELTQEEKDSGKNRPENVVGSYAVYASENKVNYVGGKEYKTGQVGMIYRPRIEDVEGNFVWGELNIDKENGLLTVTIPQEFLDTAIYPVRHAAGLTFGYTTQGSTDDGVGGTFAYWIGVSGTSGVAGVGNSISAYIRGSNSTNHMKAVLCNSDLTIATNGKGSGFTLGTTNAWQTDNFVSSPNIGASTSYFPGILVDSAGGGVFLYYNSGTNYGRKDTSNNFATPTNPTDASTNSNRYSIYVTYTAAPNIVGPFPTFIQI